MNDIKIKVKKSELEYCFKADNYDEFHRRFTQLTDIMYQRFINELIIDIDLAYAKHKQKVSSVYGVCAKRGNTK